MIRKILAIAFLVFLSTSPAYAGNQKPLTLKNGQMQQLQSGDVLINAASVRYLLFGDTTGASSFAVNPECWTAGGANPCLRYNAGAPPSTSDPIGSLAIDTTNSYLYQQLTPGGTPTYVQSASYVSFTSVTLANAPTAGNWLVAVCMGYSGSPSAGSGWSDLGVSHASGGTEPATHWYYKQAGVSESATQTPCGNQAPGGQGGTVWEVGGVSSLSVEGSAYVANTGSLSYTTTNANDLVLAGWGAQASSADPGAGTVSWTGSTVTNSAHYCCSGGGRGFSMMGAAQSIASTSAISPGGTFPGGQQSAQLIALKPVPATQRRFSFLTTFKNAGTSLDTNVLTVNCSTNTTCTTDGAGNVTLTAAGGTAANPTATASDTAVNGSASTFMRSDAAPAVQKGTSSQFGVVKCDGTTITCASSVLAATGPTISGTPTTNNCVKWASATALGDAGAACGSGGGGGTTNNYYAGALTLIQTQTLSGAASSVSFTSIPQGYTDLVLVGMGRGDTAAASITANLTFNGDTGSNYELQQLYGQNATATAGQGLAAANFQVGSLPAASATANYAGSFSAEVPSYSGTTFHKTILSQVNLRQGTATTDHFILERSGWWNSTAAITSATLTASAGNFAAGSTFALYGRGGSNVTVNPQPGLPVISEVVTSGSQASVTISSIPSTYRDLKVVVSGRTTGAGTGTAFLQLQFNGDTATNYGWQQMQGNGTGAGSPFNLANQTVGSTYLNGGELPKAGDIANLQGTSEIGVQNYAATTFAKSILAHYTMPTSAATTGQFDITVGGYWNSTSAITSLKITPSTGNFVDGTVITVYGIGGSPTATLPVVPPQGRLTLTSNTPVMTADATAQTTIYYAPYVGTLLPVGNVMYRFSQISYALNTTAHASGSLYDVFAYNNAGAINLCTGPAWTNATTRSAAISMDAVNAIWENTASLTCNLTASSTTTTIAAAQATYLGTFYATANGQTGVAFNPTAAAGGTNNILGMCNAYNRVAVSAQNQDATTAWTNSSSSWQALDGSNSNRISYVDCLGQLSVRASTGVSTRTSGTSAAGNLGLVVDSTTATPKVFMVGQSTSNERRNLTVVTAFQPQIGFHYVQAVQKLQFGSSAVYNDDGGQILNITLEMHVPPLLPLAVFRRRRRASNDNTQQRKAA